MDQLQEPNILQIVLLGAVAMLLLVGFMALFILVYQKRILSEKQRHVIQELNYHKRMTTLQIESEEKERKRIGADLHDSLGSLLWGAKVNASFIQRNEKFVEPVLSSFNELNQILDEGINVVRRIAWELSPEAFHYSGLSDSVKKLCDRFTGKDIEIRFEQTQATLWNDERALQVFRIIQELVTNAIKHSGCSNIDVLMSWKEGWLEIIVADNGSGFKSTTGNRGVGLWNIEQRMDLLNGKLNIGNASIGSGAQITLQIPLNIL